METARLFPNGLSSEKIVKMTLLVLCANARRNEERIRESASRIEASQIQEWADYYDESMAHHQDQRKALVELSRHIAATIG